MGKFKRLLKRKDQTSKSTVGQIDVSCPEIFEGVPPSQNENQHGTDEKHSISSSKRESFSDVKTNRLFHVSSSGGKSKNHRIPSSSASLSGRQRKSAKATGNIASGVVIGNGPQVLWYLISSLGSNSEKSLSRSWLPSGTTISQERAWSYEVRQGQRDLEMNGIRSQMNGRLYRSGNRLQGGGWSRLLLGDEFMATPSKKQSHMLKFVVPYCVCVKCRIASVKTQQEFYDMDKMLEDAEHGIGFEEVSYSHNSQLEGCENNKGDVGDVVRKPKNTVSLETIEDLVQVTELPLGSDLGLLGETLHSQEFELGTVSRISAKSARVTFSKQVKAFFRKERYTGPLSLVDISTIVAEKAKEQFRKHKGKTVRRFYICGALHKVLLEGASAIIFGPSGKSGHGEKREQLVGVLSRRQIMSVFVGNIALEESFGSFIHTNKPMYLGFGHDEQGAQSIFDNGRLGEARRLGINELRSHLRMPDGQNLVLELY